MLEEGQNIKAQAAAVRTANNVVAEIRCIFAFESEAKVWAVVKRGHRSTAAISQGTLGVQTHSNTITAISAQSKRLKPIVNHAEGCVLAVAAGRCDLRFLRNAGGPFVTIR